MTEQEKALARLGLDENEIAQVLADDKRIEKGEDLFPLSDTQKKTEKEMRQADRKPTVYQFNQRERKPNADKRFLIEAIAEFLTVEIENVNVTNPEREIEFLYHDKKYKLTLSAPRK